MYMKVLVLGPGGREHAIIRALARDPQVTEVHSAPGNAGIAQDVPVHAIDANNPEQAVALARELAADLVVIGPEAPLVAGVWAFIVVKDALEILRRRQREHILSVADNEERHLGTVQEFFDHHGTASGKAGVRML